MRAWRSKPACTRAKHVKMRAHVGEVASREQAGSRPDEGIGWGGGDRPSQYSIGTETARWQPTTWKAGHQPCIYIPAGRRKDR